MERLFVAANYYKGFRKIKFLGVRYGNVLGSRGSIVPKLVKQIKSGSKITITDPEMTRFNITMSQAVDLIIRALAKGCGGEIFIPKLKAYKVKDMKEAILEMLDSHNETEIIGVRPGEKYHESLINTDEIRNAYDDGQDLILFDKKMQFQGTNCLDDLKKSTLEEQYSSDKTELLSKNELKEILRNEKLV